MKKKLLPSDDLCFRYLFGSEAHKHITIEFLKAFLGRKDILDITILNPYSIDLVKQEVEELESSPEKEFQFFINDILVSMDDGTQIIVEMQSYHHEHFWSRFVYYALKRYVDSIKGESGNSKYGHLVPVVEIVLVNTDKDIGMKKDIENYIFVEKEGHYPIFHAPTPRILVVKLGENLLRENEEMYYWSHFLKDGEVLQDAPQVLKEAQSMLDNKIWEFEEERMRDARELGKAYMEQQIEEGREEGRKEGIEQGLEQGLEQGFERGREEGLEQGLEKGVEQSVLSVFKKNKEIPFIADILSLPEEKIKEILEKHHCI